MKTFKTILLSFLLIGASSSVNAQFWKKLKNKVKQKVENKIDREADKLIDSTLNGKKKKKKELKEKKPVVPRKSYGNATINHSKLYGTTSINQLAQTKIEKTGSKVRIIGYWDTFGVDVHDGYILNLNNITDIKNLENKTFKIPEEATLQLDYDALVKGKYDFDQKVRAGQQAVKFSSGSVTVMFNKDQNIMISFNGQANIDNHTTTADDSPNTVGGTTIVNLTGSISTTSPKYSITREFKQVENKNTQNNELSDADKAYIKEKLSPTIKIPDTFSFNKSIEIEFTDNRGDTYPMEFLLGNYPDIWGMSVAAKEMEGQGKVVMVMTPKSSTAFMDVAGMKMKKTTSLEQMGDQYNMTGKLPEDGDFDYKKTGKTKTILGYNCEEYRVDYNYSNDKGSASFWVSKDFPIQNKELPMLGMKMNNPYFSGFVLEFSTTQKGETYIMKVINMSDKNITINTSEFRKMGF